ncbi:hypothetical protein DAPPUDRAFT_328571 [Daphnia pulex]|uniref:Uncharacterized protein n=1 Tax=Daphnia pulex TaxID=6669 RepID=E9HE33_DAPPU|nr:hypothetical protein DAPPUDRAFT_328571 [Daphnia pulex]|eukprot:EFX69943.1 hypothetical protein DAPPUDRAFT_328571 [Daphnia pulex]
MTGCSFFLPFAAARPIGGVEPKLVTVDIDGFAAEVSAIVLKKELPWMEGTFGLVLMAVAKYWGWPFLKYLWEKVKLKFEPKLMIVDIDGFAAEVSAIVLKKELPWMEGTFGLVLMAVAKYWGWPFLKYLWEKVKLKWSEPEIFVSRKRKLVDKPHPDLAQEAINDEPMNADYQVLVHQKEATSNSRTNNTDSQVGNLFLCYCISMKLN